MNMLKILNKLLGNLVTEIEESLKLNNLKMWEFLIIQILNLLNRILNTNNQDINNSIREVTLFVKILNIRSNK